MTGQQGAQRWVFTSRFRRRAFGWKSRPAVERVGQALSEIRRVARTDSALAAEGAVLFLERVAPALEQVDSSSGAIGAAVNKAIRQLVPIIAAAPADIVTRNRWLERLWEAYQEDEIPYLDRAPALRLRRGRWPSPSGEHARGNALVRVHLPEISRLPRTCFVGF